jgi:recombination protein RecA
MSKKARVIQSFESIDALKEGMKKKHGTGVVSEIDDSVAKFPTNLLGFDWQLGGGLPRGRVIEIFGPESSGKTSLCLHIVGNCQRRGMNAWFIDAEHALDTEFAKEHKINIDELPVTQPDSGEQALQIVEDLIDSNLLDIIVVDSVAALVPQAEIDGEIGDAHVGLQARMLSQALRKITGKAAKSKTTIIFINQLRMKIGVMFGNPETTPGGNALKFYCSVRIDVRRTGAIGSKDNPSGITQKIKIVKNKVGIPFREKEYNLRFKGGYDVLADIIDLALNFGILKQAGAGWVSYGSDKLGQGAAVKKKLAEDKKLRSQIIKECKACLEMADKEEQ